MRIENVVGLPTLASEGKSFFVRLGSRGEAFSAPSGPERVVYRLVLELHGVLLQRRVTASP
jgi:hypothetical protein